MVATFWAAPLGPSELGFRLFHSAFVVAGVAMLAIPALREMSRWAAIVILAVGHGVLAFGDDEQADVVGPRRAEASSAAMRRTSDKSSASTARQTSPCDADIETMSVPGPQFIWIWLP